MRRLFAVLGAAVLIASLQGIAAPSSAQAFLGESLVVDGVGALTSGAEKVVKAPGFIGESIVKAGQAAGSEGASAAQSTWARAGMLPEIGVALGGFTAGWEIGTEICNASGIEGCFHLFGNGTAEDVRTVHETTAGGYPIGHWGWQSAGFVPGMPAGYVWFFGNGGSPPWFAVLGSRNATAAAHGGNCQGAADPPGSSVVVFKESIVWWCSGSGGEHVGGDSYYAYRYPMQGLSAGTNLTDNPAIPNLQVGGKPFAGNSGFAKAAQLPSVLKSTADGERLGQHIAHEISPETVPDPTAYHANGTVPNCGGLTYAQCTAKLEFEGLEAIKNTLGWQTAALGTAADRVVSTSPAAGASVSTHTKVTVTVNPALALMPVLVPEPEPHETYDHYVARLPAPLSPHRQTVPEAQIVPDAGPDAVLEVTPEPDTRADPQGETDLNIRTNPNDAPPIGGAGGGGTCTAGIGAVDWSPLNKPLGNKFPFGVFGFFVGWVQEWEAGEGTPPNWTLTLVPSGVFGSDGIDVHVNFAFLAPIVSICRVVFLFAAFVGLLWFLGTAAAKLQGDAS